MLRVVNLTVFICSLFVPVFSVGKVAAEESIVPEIIISEVKVRYDTAVPLDYDEFIELYNLSSGPIDLANYFLEYYNATNPTVTQQPTQKPIIDKLLGVGEHLILAKQPDQISLSVQSPFSSLSDSGGRLRLVTTEGDIVDEIAWTNSASTASPGTYPAIVYQCNASTILCSSNRTQSFSRSQNVDGHYLVADAVWSLGLPSPLSSEPLDYPEIEPEEPPTVDPEEGPVVPSENGVSCEGTILSELLPNPAGSDTGREYIELYNPTNEVISLKGCSLQTSANSKQYSLPELSVDPNVHVVFANSVTGLTLPNNTGGTVWLLSPTEEVSETTYAANMEDDASWWYINQVWQISYTPTPGAANVEQAIKPCPSGQIRNLDTNRCQNSIVTAVATLTPCKVGQERNLETNRCRTVASTVSSLVTCKAGQERNPETNRCRNTATASDLKPCPEGQERSSDTNRCRKATSGTSDTLSAVTDIPAASVNTHPKWWLAILALSLAIGYAIYEWRQDVRQFYEYLKSRLSR
jgi:hypothetical protein